MMKTPRTGATRPLGRRRRTVAMAGLASLVACGGATSLDPRRSTPADASVARGLDAGIDPPDAESDAPGDAGLEADGDASCADLASRAQSRIAAVLGENLACAVDDDCVSIFFGSAACAYPCSVLTNEAGVAAVREAAALSCEPFDTQGCEDPEVPCAAPPPSICAGGTCAVYTLYASQVSPALTHGACTAFQANYRTLAGSPLASHDIVVRLSASNGTLYSDAACTTVLASPSVTIPAGSNTTPFGFVPAAAGLSWIVVDGVVSSWTAD
jgi:hypothetical protein